MCSKYYTPTILQLVEVIAVVVTVVVIHYVFALLWHKDGCMGHPVMLRLTGFLVLLANHYIPWDTFSCSFSVVVTILMSAVEIVVVAVTAKVVTLIVVTVEGTVVLRNEEIEVTMTVIVIILVTVVGEKIKVTLFVTSTSVDFRK